METFANIVALLVGILCLAVACLHEWKWWGRMNWLKATGTVTGIEEQGPENDEHAIISFLHDGEIHEFTSEYGGSGCPKVGEMVKVLYHPETMSAEHLNSGNRLLFTIAPLFFGIIFCALGIAGIHSKADEAKFDSQREVKISS